MNDNSQKTLDIICYIIKKCQDEGKTLGATRLNKILWLADLSNFRETGKTITNEKYVKDHFGPVLQSMPMYESTLQVLGNIKITRSQQPMIEHKYSSLKYDESLSIDKKEKNMIDKMIDFACKSKAKELSELTHDSVYKLLSPREEMPIPVVAWWGGKARKTNSEEKKWSERVIEDYKNGLYE